MRTLAFIFLSSLGFAAAQTPDTEKAENVPLEGLEKSAKAFVKAYNDKDAAALAALFTPDAEMIDDEGTVIAGQEELEGVYADVFEARPDAKAALEATSVRLLTPKLAIEEGALYITEAEDGEPAAYLYTAIHTQQEDGSWLIARTVDEEVTNLSTHEAISDVDGLVGDWIGRTDAGSLKFTFTWNPSGTFLVGKAVYQAVGLEPATFTMRIGWDSVREDIVSWTFDSTGGHSKAEWHDVGDRWILKANGYTGDGEITSSTQVLAPTSKDSFVWSVRDKIVDGQLLPDRTLNMVRQPPNPALSGN